MLTELWNDIKVNGFWQVMQKIMDPNGINDALQTLNLQKGCTLDEIKKKYRELSKKWHPDKFLDPDKKIEAQEKFMKIQQSYEILTKENEHEEF